MPKQRLNKGDTFSLYKSPRNATVHAGFDSEEDITTTFCRKKTVDIGEKAGIQYEVGAMISRDKLISVLGGPYFMPPEKIITCPRCLAAYKRIHL